MKDDLIKRQDVLDYIDNMPSELTSDGRRMVRRIRLTEYIADTLPSAEPERKWIPITEALPEEHQRVLVTIKRTDGEMRVRSGNYSDDYFWIDNGDYWKCNEVLAWMPLPEPWRGE